MNQGGVSSVNTSNILYRIRNISALHLIVVSAFAVALTSAVCLGLITKQTTVASNSRECALTAINYKPLNGGCGALDANEYISDLRANDPSDMQAVAKNFTSDFRLDPSEYDKFAANAKMGTVYKDGRVVVDNQVVLNNAWSITRQEWPGHTTPYSISGAGSYYRISPQAMLQADAMPALVYFNDQGVVQYAVVNACGNPLAGDRVTPTATCQALNATQSADNPNKYTFTTTADFTNNATVSRVEYTFSDDGSTVTKTSLSDPVEHTFKKSGTVTAKVFAKVPGGREIEVAAVNCAKTIEYVPPMFVCAELISSALDDQKRKFRFVAKTAQDKYTQLVSSNFTLDGTNTVTGVTDKDTAGNIFRDYEFAADGQTHTVLASVTFNTLEGTKTVTCQSAVTTATLQPPMCTIPGKQHLLANSPDCGVVLPAAAPVVVRQAALPNTGTGGLMGAFAGMSALGALGHHMFVARRRKHHNI